MSSKLSKQSVSFRHVVFSIAAILLLGACGPEQTVERAEVARPVRLITIGHDETGESLEIPGSVRAAQSAELAFEVAGQMSDRLVEEGMLVTAGQVVAKLDPRDYLARRDRARASRDTAKADYDRYVIAYKSNAVTGQELSRAEGEFGVAQADFDVAQKALDDTELRAPFDGRIAQRLVDDFANVTAKQPVMVLQDESSLELRVDVSERDWVRSNSSISRDELTKIVEPKVRVASLADRLFPAYVKEMGATADPVTRTYRVTFGFASPEDVNISPGMTGSVVVSVNSRRGSDSEGLSVPSNIVLADANGDSFVWVIDATTMRADRRPVQLGEFSGSNVQILGGLESGDRVAASGVHSITENLLVREFDDNK